jgi:iron complex outermembrane receptor protein
MRLRLSGLLFVQLLVATASAQQKTAAPADSSKVLQEITVYGQKRQIASITKTPTPLIDLPISVQLVDRKLMDQQQIIDIRDAMKNVSGITVTGTYGEGYAMFNGRGFGLNFNSNYRWNGILMQTSGRLYGDNIERMEVLKGPASIQYGDVAPGAVLNFVSKKPLEQDYRRFEMKAGTYGLLRPTLDVSGALTADRKLLYRINATYETSKHFIDHIKGRSFLLAPTISWKILPGLEWNVELVARGDDRTFAPGLVSPDGTFEGLKKLRRGLFLGEPDNKHRYDELATYSTLSYRISKSFSIRNVSYYSKGHEREESVFFPDGKADAQGLLNRTTEFFQTFTKIAGTSLDLVGKLSTAGIQHDFAVGIDYTKRDYTIYYNDPVILKPINIYNPVYGQDVLPKIIGYDGDPRTPSQFIKRLGVYAQDQLKFWNNRVHVMLGLRYNRTARGTDFTATVPAPADYKDDVKEPMSPRVAVLVKPVAFLSVYGSYTQSYEQNGWDEITKIMLASTNAKQLEVGVKANLLKEKLGIGVSLFQIDKRNIVGYVFGLNEAPSWEHLYYHTFYKWAMYQGGHHRSRGIELDVNGKPLPQLTVNMAASYIDATVVEDPAFKAGNQLEGNARQTFNIWGDYTFDKGVMKGFDLGYGFFYKGKFYATTENAPSSEVKSYWSMDASVGYTVGSFFSRFNVSNLTDQRGYLARSGLYEPMWGRRAILSIGVKF